MTSNAMFSCPLCGCDDLETSPWPANRDRTLWVARCGNPDCGCEVSAKTIDECAKRWNRRPSHEPCALLDEMRNRMECHFQPCASYWTTDDDMVDHFDPKQCDCKLGKPVSPQPPPVGREAQFRALLERAQPLLIAAGLYTSSAVEAKTQLLTDIASALTKQPQSPQGRDELADAVENNNLKDIEIERLRAQPGRCEAITTPRHYAEPHRCPFDAKDGERFCGTHLRSAPTESPEYIEDGKAHCAICDMVLPNHKFDCDFGEGHER